MWLLNTNQNSASKQKFYIKWRSFESLVRKFSECISKTQYTFEKENEKSFIGSRELVKSVVNIYKYSLTKTFNTKWTFAYLMTRRVSSKIFNNTTWLLFFTAWNFYLVAKDHFYFILLLLGEKYNKISQPLYGLGTINNCSFAPN